MKHLPSRCAVLGVLGSAVVLSLSTSVVRAEGDRNDATSSGQAAVTTAPAADVAMSGAMIAKDKKTGELRPATAKEMKKLQAKTVAAKEGARQKVTPVETVLPNGAVVTTLDPSTEVFSVATKGADGKVHTTCVPGEKVESVLAAAAAQNGNLTKKEVLDEK